MIPTHPTPTHPTPTPTTMKLHPSITLERILAAAEESMFGMSDYGFCIACGEEAHGIEPDARKYECETCGRRAVYGGEELMMMGLPAPPSPPATTPPAPVRDPGAQYARFLKFKVTSKIAESTGETRGYTLTSWVSMTISADGSVLLEATNGKVLTRARVQGKAEGDVTELPPPFVGVRWLLPPEAFSRMGGFELDLERDGDRMWVKVPGHRTFQARVAEQHTYPKTEGVLTETRPTSFVLGADILLALALSMQKGTTVRFALDPEKPLDSPLSWQTEDGTHAGVVMPVTVDKPAPVCVTLTPNP